MVKIKINKNTNKNIYIKIDTEAHLLSVVKSRTTLSNGKEERMSEREREREREREEGAGEGENWVSTEQGS